MSGQFEDRDCCLSGDSDPYMLITVAGRTCETAIIDNGNAPSWSSRQQGSCSSPWTNIGEQVRTGAAEDSCS